MAIRNHEIEKLITQVRMTLSRPPATAGVKLRSDRELASTLKLEPYHVRSALQQLEKEGILVRRRGSGTFVRRMATMPAETAGLKPIPPKKLFKDEPPDRSGALAENAHAKLRLSLWGDLQQANQTSQQIYASIVSEINGLGHQLSAYSMFRSYIDPFTPDELARHISENPCDGHIVLGHSAERFRKALGNDSTPVVYFSSGSVPVRHEPLVMFNTVEAAERAVRLLVAEGFHRIGFVGLESPYWLIRPESFAYESAMRREGSRYSAISFVDAPTVASATKATRQLLSMAIPPDALYISDDYLMTGVLEALTAAKLKPGKDIGIITLANLGSALPDGYDWSRLQFDPADVGQAVAERLLKMIQKGVDSPSSLSIHAKWHAGKTHTCQVSV